MGVEILGETQLAQNAEQLQTLEQMYEFRKKEKVLKFIYKSPFLIALLLEAPAILKKYFKTSQLSLQVYNDPESAEEDHLIIFISTTLGAKEAVRALHKIDKEWWLDKLEQAQEKLSINLEYI